MKINLRKRITSMVVLFSIILSSVAILNFNVSAVEGMILLGNIYRSSLTDTNPTDTLYFRLPENESYSYVVETYGETDTFVQVKDGLNIYSDNDSGNNLNAAVGFYATKNATNQGILIITVTHATGGTGDYLIHIRRQRAQIYTFNYGDGDINTTGDATIPLHYLRTNCGYDVKSYQNCSASHLNEADDSNLARINSEVFFYSGHGHQNGIAVFPDSSAYADVSFPNISNTKLAVWSACYSAVAEEGRESLAQASVTNGARSAIGWTDSVLVSSATSFTDKLFESLGGSNTVLQAAQQASNTIIWPWDNIHDYVIFGDSSVRINLPAINTKQVRENSQTNTLNPYERNIAFSKFDMPNGTVRYYKNIDGIITNEYYTFDNSGTEIYHSDIKISSDDISSVSKEISFDKYTYLPKKEVEIGKKIYNKLVESDSHNAYVKINGEVIPIKITYSTYKNDAGLAYQDVVCVNLNNGTYVDYSDIC